jgi:uncharacterized OB-fold protein
VTDRRPRPQPEALSRFYWDGAAAGRLLLQRCRSCEQLQFPPDVCCVHCQSDQFDHVEVSGSGSIYTYAVVERALHAGFVDAVPYVVALVELVEQPGLRLITNVVDTPPERIYCGMPVAVVFEDRGGVTMPQFRATPSSLGSS